MNPEELELRDFLLKHSRSKSNGNFTEMGDNVLQARVLNPTCGDQVELRVLVISQQVQKIEYRTQSCAICAASASLLSTFCVGKKVSELAELNNRLQLTLQQPPESDWPTELQALKCWQHLRINPLRQRCALLPWTGLLRAVGNISAN